MLADEVTTDRGRDALSSNQTRWGVLNMRSLIAGTAAVVVSLIVSATAFAGTEVCFQNKAGGSIKQTKGGTCAKNFTLKEIGGSSSFSPEEEATLKSVLPHIKYVAAGVGGKPTVQFSGVNVQIVNGEGKTASVNGEGNLVIGYDENAQSRPQTGSHNLILGEQQEFTSFAGILSGFENAMTARFATAIGGEYNTVSAANASITGGESNLASGPVSSVSGGFDNTASGPAASITGGEGGKASGEYSSITAGRENSASGPLSTVSGGVENRSLGFYTSVSGGGSNTAEAGYASVSGGALNTAGTTGGDSVSGGKENTATGEAAWIGGGIKNSTGAAFDAISGGEENSITGAWDSISGGQLNLVESNWAWIGGGYKNTVTSKARWSTIYGGKEVKTTGEYEAKG